MRDVADADTIAISETVADDAPQKPSHPAIARGQLIGRFVALEELGTGGMGVVYAAYDPNLDRKVAIKLLRAQAMASDEAHARLLREAQAMARIDHPNVLRVHEAGTLGEQIYIAMEFAAGGTLRQWLAAKPRTSEEIVRVFVQAGRGLAAAHAAGLVHRDFKPDNVLLVGDGEPRVTDFGLVGVVGEQPPARPSDPDKPVSENTPLSRDLTRTGALMGTPAYMAPEQFRGGVVGPAADQFAFCVALYEAVYGARPFAGATFPELCANVLDGAIQPAPADRHVPAWLRRVLLRGLALEPSKRYAAMDALLAELARDKRGRTYIYVAAGGAALVAAAVAVLVLGGRDHAVCSGADGKLATAWSPAQKQKLAAAFAASARPDANAVLARAVPLVDEWGDDWQHAYIGACEDTRVRQVQSEHVLDLRMDCLNRALDETRSTIDALAAGGGDGVDHAIDVVRELPAIPACSDTTALANGIQAPPTLPVRIVVAAIRGKLDQSRAQRKLVHYPAALAIARSALDEARATKYEPLIGEALFELARVQEQLADPTAGQTYASAMSTAAAAGDIETSILAAARRLVWMSNRAAQLPVADEISTLASALATHAALRPATRVDLENAAGKLLQTERKWDEAQARYDHAMQLASAQLPKDSPELVSTLEAEASLALDRHKYADAKKLFEQVIAAQERIVGKAHPSYANALDHLATVLTSVDKTANVKALHEQALAIRLAALGPDHPDVAASYAHLGGYYAMIGDNAQAKALFEKSLALQRKGFGEDGVEQTPTLVNYGLVLENMGEFDAARGVMEHALALREKAYGRDSVQVTHVLQDLALALRGQHHYDEAIAMLERAKRINEAVWGPNDGDVLNLLGDLAQTYKDAGKLPEAKEQMTHAIELMSEIDGPQSLRVGMAYGNYGFLQVSLGDLAGALASFQKSHDILEAKLGKTHPNVAFAQLGMAQCLIRTKREAEAVPLIEHAIEIGTAAHIAKIQLAEFHYYLALALAPNRANRARARSEATIALGLYKEGHSDVNVKIVEKFLKKN